MEVLFKDDNCIYGLTQHHLDRKYYNADNVIELANIPHLDDIDILYYYRNIYTDRKYPVYYEYDGFFITKSNITTNIGEYITSYIHTYYIKDYTLINLRLLKDI